MGAGNFGVTPNLKIYARQKRWLDTVENYMRAAGLSMEDVENKDEWGQIQGWKTSKNWGNGKGEE